MKNAPERWEAGIEGPSPHEWYGLATPSGASGPWLVAPVGSMYFQRSNTAGVSTKVWTKGKNDGRDDDWVLGMRCLSVTITRAMMTDGGSTTGTYDLAEQIPAGAWVLQALLVNVTGFTGNTSATIQIGDTSTVARYSTGTPSVFTTAAAIDPGVPSGTKIHTAAATVRVTITGATDFTAISAGQLTLRIYYLA